jgi:hypothetical protein
MIESILRHAMGKVAIRLQLHPRLERFRARLPYFPIPGLVALLFILPAAALVALAQALGYRGTPEVSLSRTWWTLALAPPGAAAVFAVFEALGWVSGYRPFRRTWDNLPPHAARDLSVRLQAAAQANEFSQAWHDAQTGEFVAVRNMELEKQNRIASGTRFPMRLSVFVRALDPAHAAVDLKLANRTVVVWDTGERETCCRVGEAVVAAVVARPAAGATA